MKKANPERLLTYDSNYKTFLKLQKQRSGEQMGGCQGKEEMDVVIKE